MHEVIEASPVAVLGATGFIGRHLCASLTRAGRPVRAIVRRSDAIVAGNIAIVPDLRNEADLAASLEGCTRIVHLADEAGRLARNSVAQPIARSLANVIGSSRVRLVYASSIYARLSAEGKNNDYGERKRAQEDILGDVERSVGLRLPPVYGPGCGGSYAMLEKAVSTGLPLPFGLADKPRSYLSIANLCDLIQAILDGPESAWAQATGRVFEPDDGKQVSTRDLARRMGRAMGRPARLFPVPRALLSLVAGLTGKQALVSGAFDELRSRDGAELATLFGWRPQAPR